ncbi:MAG: DUF1361 domain-containing protein [Bacteroidales bacterium]|nr:DUF1361 domain-containing protein [Bacteroidales bacterium]
MGRYGRWNSWDVFFNPVEIVERVIYMILHPANFPGFYGMTIAIYIFLALLFSFFRNLSDPAKPLLFTQFLKHEI